MLQTIRDRMTGPTIWVIVGLISIPFAFFGIDTFNTGGADPTVAKVGDQKITQAQLEAAYQQRLQRLQQMLGENFRSDMIEPARFREGVLQEMVQETALQQHARKVGYTASDAAILDAIRVIPAFQKDGQFSAELYHEALAAQGLSASGFEAQMREGLGMDQIRDGVLASAFVTPAEAAAAWRLARQERVFSSVSFKASDYDSTVTISDAEVAQRYADKAAQYKAPERIKLNVVELDLAQLPEAAVPENAVLKALYDADSNAFTTAEERRARHILVSFGADKSAALKKAQEIKARLDAKADFATVATEVSDDPGSKTSGGDLGWVRRGLMTPRFEQSLFSLGKLEISEPVETEFGWHIIQLADIKPAVTRAFEDPAVQAELLASYRKRDTEKRFQELSEKLEQLAFENSSSLDAVAQALGTQVETTDWFTRTTGTGLTANPEVVKAAFSPEVLQDNENSKPLAIAANRVAVVRKAEYEAARPLSLDEVKGQIHSALKAEKALAQAKTEAEALLQAVLSGADLASAAAERQKSVDAPGAVRRDAASVDRTLLNKAFSLPRPAAGKLSAATLQQGQEAVVVVALSEVRDATPQTDDSAYQQQSTQLRDALAGAEFAGFRSHLEARIGIERKSIEASEPAIDTPANP